ncbi:winged helix-turn-helix transcriptional regulator [Mucilaginibacter pedocola]|uniref:HxlR family transcriptional regulator n=1 Tax=Mucilaginibacter pedocola TaxID=1792845 RepID=A0A1S9PHW0_9SPHI|nr:helix-turn-helix domain-containing protein [Mucilaginibacter pedocola]OOQ60532.1 HxlR family transcriptional regulator [Mucilaginibacter pedocola]
MSQEWGRDAVKCNAAMTSVADALYVIGGKWKLRVIVALREGYTRFNEIQRSIDGISARVLSAELKELELNGFVKREVIAQTPVVVEYHITPYADTLSDILKALMEWGTMHRDKLRSER